MKTTFIIFCLFAGSYIGRAQDFIIGLQVESTVAGMQSGTTIMYESKGAFAIGGFYQRDLRPSRDLETQSSFYGGQIQIPLIKSERLLLSGIIRGGVVNEFVVLVPGLETRVNIRRRFALAIGSSMRMNYPAISGKMILKIF